MRIQVGARAEAMMEVAVLRSFCNIVKWLDLVSDVVAATAYTQTSTDFLQSIMVGIDNRKAWIWVPRIAVEDQEEYM